MFQAHSVGGGRIAA